MSQYQFKLYSQARYLEAMKEQKENNLKIQNFRTKYKKPYSDSSIDFKPILEFSNLFP